MKIVRFGMTESGILLLSFALKYINMSPDTKTELFCHLLWLTNWLYTTSGYYDKAVKGKNKDFTESAYTENFNKLIEQWEVSLDGCEETQFMFHDGFIRELFENIKDAFRLHYRMTNFVLLNDTKKIDTRVNKVPEYYEKFPHFYGKMRGKKILVVSSFAELCVQQYDSGNVFKLGGGLTFPQIEGVVGVTSPYCFLNNGPHDNYFETLAFIFEEIKKADFEVAVLGCGVYGHMLTHLIHADLKKDAIYLGGCVTNLFGILTKREKIGGMGKYYRTDEFWILDIPDKYKPLNYKEIEDGCYW